MWKWFSYLYGKLVAFFVPRQILLMRENSWRWKKLRAEHLQKEPACVVCGRTQHLEVHHVIPVAFAPEKQFSPENLITLCAYPCHIMFGHFFCYHCYNKDVRKMAEEFRKAMNKRRCLEKFRKK
jgi:5-methylcytosine-specific restriction enzyme A